MKLQPAAARNRHKITTPPYFSSKTPTMVETVFPDQQQLPQPNKRAPPINILTVQPPEKERIELVENKGITTNFQQSEHSNIAISTIDNSTTAPNQSLTTVPRQQKTGKPKETNSPSAQNLQGLIQNESRFDIGYDSDGEIGPFSDAILQEGQQLFHEPDDTVPQQTTTPPPPPPTTAQDKEDAPGGITSFAPAPAETTTTAITCSDVDLMNKTVVWLKQELQLRLQPTTGNKSANLIRLKQAMRDGLKRYSSLHEAKAAKKMAARAGADTGAGGAASRTGNARNTQDGMKTFHPDAVWRPLQANNTVVEEPANPTFRIGRAPTIPLQDAAHVPVKHNFSESFAVPEFSGKHIKYELNRRGSRKRDCCGQQIFTEELRERGVPDPVFLSKHKLGPYSYPWEFANAFIPFHQDKKDKNHFSFELLMQWTNLKAALAGAGTNIYKGEYHPFSTKEIRQHFGLYVLHGISPTPRIEYKFSPEHKDRVCGNTFVHTSFGTNAKNRHKQFKAFLACCNPCIPIPSKEAHPNWKVRPLLKWMNYQYPRAWKLGRACAVDEMTMRFKGKHKDKRRITYKAEGDGFQSDALCDDGYCYQIYMRNDPAPKKYLKQGLSPLHSRTMALFDSLKDDFHQVGMDNLYNSAAFCRAAFNHPRKILCHGVARKAGRGVPTCVLQEEVKNVNDQRAVRGTVKAAVLEGDPGCPNLIATSVYDTKPVHYLSMVSQSIEWIVKEKSVFNVDTNEVETLKFLRLNQINKYNLEMGGVDIADQLRGVYRIDRWVRNRKWWWSILFWSIGVSLTNAYKLYLRLCEDEGVNPEYREHFSFRRAIAEYWINPDLIELESPKKKATKLNATGDNDDTEISPMTECTSLSNSYGDKSTGVGTVTRITDATLDERGALRCRLERSLDHLCERPTKRTRCSLHWWAGKCRKESDIVFCPTCNVHLCVDCYGPFHRIPSLVPMKKQLVNKYKKERHQQQQQKPPQNK